MATASLLSPTEAATKAVVVRWLLLLLILLVNEWMSTKSIVGDRKGVIEKK